MLRCYEPGGRISIQDIVAYEDSKVNAYFEELEKEIDCSHHATLSHEFIIDLFSRHGISGINMMDVEIELNFREYITHAQQSETNRKRIENLLESGLHDPQISAFFLIQGADIFFKRNVFLILGEKL
ncbi:hypothetical protein JW960_15840 [candidate division KSB1 bacterium]|nr:hypothetical protein [candidate division KSB1 bacterium]